MIDFFNTHIDPASTTRAKLATHLLAQGKSEEIAAKTSTSEQISTLAEMISKYFAQEAGVTVPTSALVTRLSSVDVAGGDVEGIVAALESQLKSTDGMDAGQLQMILSTAPTALNSLLPSLGIKGVEEAKKNFSFKL